MASEAISVVQLASSNGRGGAARVARELLDGLEARGHRARLLVGRKKGDDPRVSELFDGPVNRLLSRAAGRNLRRALHRRLMPLIANDIALLPGRRLARRPELRQADLIHAHNLHSGFFNLKALPSLAQRWPVVWTLHDMWPITGYFVHAFDCPHWPVGGCDCRLPNSLPPHAWNNSRHLWQLKRRIYARCELHLVAPSEWLAERVAGSMLRHQPLRVVPNGVDTEKLRPADRAAARRRLGLPPARPVLLWVGRGGARNPWKGWRHLERLVEGWVDEPALFLVVGSDGPPRANVHAAGVVDDPGRLSDCYNASDALLYPSLADNCPLTVLEAMACGLPVVGFATGGIPELVVDGETGYLAPSGDTAELERCLRRLLALDPPARGAMAAAARRRAVTRFGLDRMVESYVELYRELLV